MVTLKCKVALPAQAAVYPASVQPNEAVQWVCLIVVDFRAAHH